MKLEYYDSLQDKVVEEKVCSGGIIKFIYSNPFGKCVLWALFKRKIFSKLCGIWADSRFSRAAALNFISENKISTDEMLDDAGNFKTFNEFFTRAIKESARPIASGCVLFPADARHLAYANVSQENFFYAKNRKFNLEKLLHSKELAARFAGGAMMISRLSPLDYHRFHYPIGGRIVVRKNLKGALYSVSPLALSERLDYLLENERVLNLIEMDNGSLAAVIQIGATNVGTIVNFDGLDSVVEAGKPMGLFRFGGSCVITLFEAGKIAFNADLLEKTASGLEYYAKVNSAAGKFIS